MSRKDYVNVFFVDAVGQSSDAEAGQTFSITIADDNTVTLKYSGSAALASVWSRAKATYDTDTDIINGSLKDSEGTRGFSIAEMISGSIKCVIQEGDKAINEPDDGSWTGHPTH